MSRRKRKIIYPVWMLTIPHYLKILERKTKPGELLDRKAIEQAFSIHRTAATALLTRLGAARVGNALWIERDALIGRMRQVEQNPELRWQVQRRHEIAERIKAYRLERTIERSRKTVVPLPAPPDTLHLTGLPTTIEIATGRVTIRCADLDDLIQQLVLLCRACDTDTEKLRAGIDPMDRPKPAERPEPGEQFRVTIEMSGGAGSSS